MEEENNKEIHWKDQARANMSYGEITWTVKLEQSSLCSIFAMCSLIFKKLTQWKEPIKISHIYQSIQQEEYRPLQTVATRYLEEVRSSWTIFAIARRQYRINITLRNWELKLRSILPGFRQEWSLHLKDWLRWLLSPTALLREHLQRATWTKKKKNSIKGSSKL